jgi:lipopolysaccharide/colanic/teichoic acid biosynthesis glycosyltransferase
MQKNINTNFDELRHGLYETSQGNAAALSYSRVVTEWDNKASSLIVAFITRINREKAIYRICKRGLDISVSLAVLLILAPLFGVVAILIKLNSPGPVFFKHSRLGKDGKEFPCVKFRTMVADAEERLRASPYLLAQFEEKFKIEDDPRVTRLGRFLRRTSIDELPQFFQVLLGDMTLIGPRPVVKKELIRYGVYQNRRLSVRPGLSGLWQACGRTDTSYDERLRLDMFYIDHRCFSLDVLLLFLTVIAVIRGRGAC